MSRNELITFPNTSALTALMTLDVSYNLITYVPASHISSGVTAFYITDNPLTCLPAAVVSVIPFPHHVYIGDKLQPRIDEFPCDFTNLFTLKVHGYVNDSIKPCDLFSVYASVRTLAVTKGNLVQFPSLQFAERLVTLELMKNKIKLLPNGTDIPIQNLLERIDVSHNDIETVPSHFFLSMNKLVQFTIRNNQVKVLCDSMPFINFGKKSIALALLVLHLTTYLATCVLFEIANTDIVYPLF